jgi:phthiocerol/phenolphthiocerol synthesis type-I polyketide synthase E
MAQRNEFVVHRSFEKTAEQFPRNIAIDDNRGCITYRMLNSEANRVANALINSDVRPGTVVGIYSDANTEYLVALLGTLKAGAVFMPIDIESPDSRFCACLNKAETPILITSSSFEQELLMRFRSLTTLTTTPSLLVLHGSRGPIVKTLVDGTTIAGAPDFSDRAPSIDVGPDDGCYLIMTSGSTGIPKAILGSQKGLCHFMRWEINELSLTDKVRVSALSAVTFDVSLRDIFSALLSGGTLCLPDKETRHNPVRMLDWLQDSCVTLSHLVPTVFRLLTQEVERRGKSARLLSDLEYVLLAGEELYGQDVARWRRAIGDRIQLLNLYGPSETTLAKLFFRIGSQTFAPHEIIPIGRPIPDTDVLIIDGARLCPAGETGEIHIQTSFRSKGYYKDDLLNKERFIQNTFSKDPRAVLYRTGDYGRILPDGNIKFEGRHDEQIKLYGNRVEIGEIETVLRQHDQIYECAVAVKEQVPGDKRLIGYIVPKSGMKPTPQTLRQFVAERLPDYMVPSAFVMLEILPRTHSGKIDRQALPEPSRHRPDIDQPYAPASTKIESKISEIWCRVLGLDRVGLDDNFFDLGGTSVLAARVVALVHETLGANISIVEAFQHPNIRDFSSYLQRVLAGNLPDPKTADPTKLSRKARVSLENPIQPSSAIPAGSDLSGSIAIIGMAGRFPGAPDVDKLWKNLCRGVESIDFFSDKDLDPSIDPDLRNNPNYVKARGFLKDEDKFDPAFFGMTPGEAVITDPQHRIFLETAWQALEAAGYAPGSYEKPVGVFGGTGYNTYLTNHVLRSPKILDQFGEHQIGLANGPDYLTLRVSYKLNLKGPSVSLYTGCSLSLVAVCQACESLLTRQCDMALAGGAFVLCPLKSGYLYQEGEMFSPDGHCRPFDASAQGTVFSNGVGIVVLKRFEDAWKDGDFIYAVIRGTGINNDGSKKMSFAAPSVDGQAEVVTMALAKSNVEPETINYVEMHGTGTPVGDPIEVAALTQAYSARTSKKRFCGIGSIKSNIGHLDAAAGVAGLLKAALMLHHKKILPSLNFREPNPEIDFAKSPFFVTTQFSEWKAGRTPRRAGVTSLGVGGTNAHAVLEEAPARPDSGPSRPWTLLVLSAKTERALDTMTVRLAGHLKENPNLKLADVAYTLQIGRKAFNQRRVVVHNDVKRAIATLETKDPTFLTTSVCPSARPDVAFMFSGQGAQYVNMAAELYQKESVYKEAIDHCAEILKPYLTEDIRELLYPKQKSAEEAAEVLKQTSVAQPALFVTAYALARLWGQWGVHPSAMLGHSIGEYVAACLAGVFSLEDALALVAIRGQLMQSMPRGCMLAVSLSEQDIRPLLGEGLSLAAVNGPSLCIVSGDEHGIACLESSLSQKQSSTQRLQTSHAFHSYMMEPIVERFTEHVRQIALKPPRIPFLSNVSGTWITPKDAIDPAYWATQLRQTVRFSDCLGRLYEEPGRVLLEVGPGRTLSTLAKQHPLNSKDHVVLSSIRHPKEEGSDIAFILNTLGRLWLAGVDVDWAGFHAEENRYRLPLPTYPFERKLCWIDAVKTPTGDAGATQDNALEGGMDTAPVVDRSTKRLFDRAKMPFATEEVEQALFGLWQELLGVEHVTPQDNFFDLGGNSMLAVRLFTQIEKVFGKKLPLGILYEAPTPALLAAILYKREAPASWASLVEIQRGGSTPPLFLVHGAGGNILIYHDLAAQLGFDQPVFGLQSQGLDGRQPFLNTVEDMASRYLQEIRATHPKGPYLLGGYCLGGSVALEMARQLREQGQDVPLVILFETYNFSNIGPMSLLANARYYLQRVEFHMRNFLLLEARQQWTFLKEKGKVAIGRTRIWAGKPISFLSRKMKREGSSPSLLFDLWKANDLAAIKYVPKPYSGHVVLFVPMKEYAHHLRPGLELGQLITGTFDSYKLPVYPAGMMVKPFVELLAGKVKDCIKKALKAS